MAVSPRQDRYSELSGAYESDWQLDSMLAFADQLRSVLSTTMSVQPGNINSQQLLTTLVTRFITAARKYYETGKGLFGGDPFQGVGYLGEISQPNEHRRILEDIGAEWARLMSLVSTAHFFESQRTNPAVQKLMEVIRLAWTDLRLDDVWPKEIMQGAPAFAVLPHFGRHFELVKFRYAPEIVVLGIPVTSLYSPWDWTFIWHEIAGVYIEYGYAKPDGVVQHVRMELQKQLETAEIWASWQTLYNGEMNPLPIENGTLNELVVQNWAEELVEDAVGVLCLGDCMVSTLDAVLTRYYGHSGANIVPFDLRHPPRSLRVEVARSLSYQMGLRADDTQDAGARAVAQQILAVQDRLVTQLYRDVAHRNEATLDAESQLRKQIAKATLDFRQERKPGEEIRAELYGNGTGYNWTQPLNQTVQGPVSDPVKFWEYAFSEVDLGTANIERGTSHYHYNNADAEAIIRITGIAAHGGFKHELKLKLTHHHANAEDLASGMVCSAEPI